MGKRKGMATIRKLFYYYRLKQVLNHSVLTPLCSWTRWDWLKSRDVNPTSRWGRHATRGVRRDAGSSSKGGKHSFSLSNWPRDCAGHCISNHGNLPVTEEHAGET